MKRKKVRKFLSKRRFLNQLFVISFAAVCLLIFLSLFGTFIGDKLFVRDKFEQARQAYALSRLFNPFNTNLEKRLLAVEVSLGEREMISEEFSLNKNFKPLVSVQFRNVLGVSVTVPVLMYHYIRVNPDSHDIVGYNLSVTPSNFEAQMNYLAANGYHTISLDELGAVLFGKASLPSKPIVLTFDDGYADCYYNALPILRSHGFKGVNFIATGLIGAPGYLTWEQIDEMKLSGVFTFAAHTVHHFSLTYLPNDKVKYELSESKNTLQAHVGYPINWLAYPYGSVNSRVVRIASQVGFVGAYGTNFGTYQSTDRMFTLPRIRISGSDSVSSFAAKL